MSRNANGRREVSLCVCEGGGARGEMGGEGGALVVYVCVWVYLCVWVCGLACVSECVCVCVSERERERESIRTHTCVCVCLASSSFEHSNNE